MFKAAAAALVLLALGHAQTVCARCRARPGSSNWPTQSDWDSLNSTVDGRLVAVVPSAQECAELGCTDAQWFSATFRNTLPGQMNVVRACEYYSCGFSR